MAERFECDHCGAAYRAKPELLGRSIRCKSCGDKFTAQLKQEQQVDILAELEKLVPGGEQPVSAEQAAARRTPMQQATGSAASAGQAPAVSPGPSVKRVIPPPSAMDDDTQTRYGRDEASKVLFMVAALLYLVYVVVVLAMMARQVGMENLPIGQMILFTIVGLLVTFLVGVPITASGLWLTQKAMKFNYEGSAYINTLGWSSAAAIPAVVGGLIMMAASGGSPGAALTGAALGLLFALLSLIVMPVAFWYLHGLKVVEALVAIIFTFLTSTVGGVVMFAVFFVIGLMFGGLMNPPSPEDPRTAGPTTQQQQPQQGPFASNPGPSNPNPRPHDIPPPPPPKPYVDFNEHGQLQTYLKRHDETHGRPVESPDPYELIRRGLASEMISQRTRMLDLLTDAPVNPDQYDAVQRAMTAFFDQNQSRTRDRQWVQAITIADRWELEDTDRWIVKGLEGWSTATYRPLIEFAIKRQVKGVPAILVKQSRRYEDAATYLPKFGEAGQQAIIDAFENGEISDWNLAKMMPLLKMLKADQAIPLLRPLADHRQEEIAKPARAMLLEMAPKSIDLVDQALADLKQSDWRRLEGLKTLAKVEANPQDLMRVGGALIEVGEDMYLSMRYRPNEAKLLTDAMNQWKSPVIASALREKLERDARESERDFAMRMLSLWQDEQSIAKFEQWLLLETDLAVAALSKYGSSIEPRMRRLVLDDNEHIVVAAVRVLGEVGTERSLAMLKRLSVSRSKPDAAPVAKVAVEAIEERLRAEQDAQKQD